MKKSLPKYFRRFLLACAILLALFGLSRLYFRLTDDFRLSNITYKMPYRQAWEVPEMSEAQRENFNEILNQKFYYVGKGAQSYAFKSEDDKYILKFFKFKHLKPSFFVDLLPSVGAFKIYKEKQVERKNRLLNSVFDGYRLAYAIHGDETGLIYIHLNKSHELNKVVTVHDKIGLVRHIDLDEVPFILQEKAKTTRTVMTELMNNQDISMVQKRIKQIFDLYLLEYSKGIYDRDHGVMHNTGFVGDKPIHLDVGKLTEDDRIKSKEFYKPDLLRIVSKFNIWFKANYPQDYPTLKAFMDEQMQLIFEDERV
ncbi:MAG: hypothetical protein HWD61_12050 [Parachlamydiaceae bacterium]|nr:MAG: hypothetical protein HWD61_12050 [Parachlamydiaceae bacterium]